MSHDLDLVKLVEDELKRARLESDILLAYSGGLDSTCLLHLLLKTRQRPVIAHCNFQLRGEESEEDALPEELEESEEPDNDSSSSSTSIPVRFLLFLVVILRNDFLCFYSC